MGIDWNRLACQMAHSSCVCVSDGAFQLVVMVEADGSQQVDEGEIQESARAKGGLLEGGECGLTGGYLQH